MFERPPRIRPISLILTDWDGVLCDSAPTLWRLYNQLVRPVSWLDFKIFLERRRLTDPILPGRLRDYEQHLVEAKIFDGARPLLELAKKLGIRVAVVSNSSRSIIENISHRNGIMTLIDRVYSSDEALMKPSPLLFDAIRSDFAVQDDQIAMLGDELTDAEFIKDRGTHFVFCAYGFGSSVDLPKHIDAFNLASFNIVRDSRDLVAVIRQMSLNDGINRRG